jgi:hypothetical protein
MTEMVIDDQILTIRKTAEENNMIGKIIFTNDLNTNKVCDKMVLLISISKQKMKEK